MGALVAEHKLIARNSIDFDFSIPIVYVLLI